MDTFTLDCPGGADDLSGVVHCDGFVNTPRSVLPYRPSPLEAVPPILTVGDIVYVLIGPNAYPGLVEQVLYDGRAWCSYYDRDYDLWVGRPVSVEALELQAVR